MDEEGPQLSDARAPSRWRLGLVLWVMGLVGLAAVMPYVARLQHDALTRASARSGLSVPLLLFISSLQGAVLLALAVAAGTWGAPRLGLGAPALARLVGRDAPRPHDLNRSLTLALLSGAAIAVLIVGLDRWVFHGLGGALGLGVEPGPIAGLLASLYGAINEEVLCRFGLLSAFALALRALGRAIAPARSREMLPGWVFWSANVAVALAFGLGHLPATAAIAPLTARVVARAIVLNGLAALLYGFWYRRRGLEWAMIAHLGSDLVLHVLFAV